MARTDMTLASINGKSVAIEVKHTPKTRDDRRHYTIVSVNVPEELVPMIPPKMTVRGQDETSDLAWDIYNREEIKVMRQVANAALNGSFGKMSFSRKAGCSCGCSPAFRTQDTRGGWTFVKAVML